MATLATQKITRAGVAPALAAASAGGDRYTPDHETFLHVKNGSASPITVTVKATEQVNGDPIKDIAVTVAASAESLIGPLPAQMFQATDGSGLADVTYSAAASVTVGAFKLSQP